MPRSPAVRPTDGARRRSTCWPSRRGRSATSTAVLLLPVEGGAVPGRPVPDGRRPARDLHPADDRVAAAARGHDRLAGRRADADGRRLLPARRRTAPNRYRRPDQTVQHTIQTNGTLLTDEWCELLAEHEFLVGIQHRRAARRCTTATASTSGAARRSTRCVRGLELLEAHGVDWNVLCTVNAANQDTPLEVYRYFRDELGRTPHPADPDRRARQRRRGFQEGDAVTDRSVDPEAWGRFLIAVFDEWVTRDVGTVFVSHFDAALASWVGVPPALCIFGETCGDASRSSTTATSTRVTTSWSPTTCSATSPTTHMVELVGVAAAAGLRRGQARHAARATAGAATCASRATASARRTASRSRPTASTVSTTCARGYQAFFPHIDGLMRIMADLLRAGRYADEVMAVLRRTGRNEPCPCGSGRKAKHCHTVA